MNKTSEVSILTLLSVVVDWRLDLLYDVYSIYSAKLSVT